MHVHDHDFRPVTDSDLRYNVLALGVVFQASSVRDRFFHRHLFVNEAVRRLLMPQDPFTIR